MKKSGTGVDDIQEQLWFGFKYFAFLHDKNKPNSETRETSNKKKTGVVTIEEGEGKVEEGEIEDLETSETEATSDTPNQSQKVTVTIESSLAEGDSPNVGLDLPANLGKTKPAPKQMKGTPKTNKKSDEIDTQLN
ncbi:hypothetical protein FQR65_LT13003 [Abscondita terminalis]|nr:hypothetical protein FQR65_LT13003 [Abscondita terminalis]